MKIEWEITPQERKSRMRQTYKKVWWIFLIGFPLGILGIVSGLSEPLGVFVEFLILLVISTFSLFVVWLLVQLSFWQKRRYVVDDEGIFICKGKKRRKILWKECKKFYEYKSHNDFSWALEKIMKIESEKCGSIFHVILRKKLFGIIKQIAVIYSEPDISAKLEKTLKEKMPKIEGHVKVSGLTKYYFG